MNKLTRTSKASAQDVQVKQGSDTELIGGGTTRIGLWALILGFGGFLIWASFAPLDEGVPGQGIIAIDTKRKAVQHLSGGIIREVLVREGELVKEGQVLVRMDEAVTKANFESARQRYFGLRAMENRLIAEQRDLPKINFTPDLMLASNDPQIRSMVQTQEQLFATRRLGLRADLQSMEEGIQGQEGLIQAYTGMMGNRKHQLSLLSEELSNTVGLVKEGYATYNRQLELQRMVSEVSVSISELQGNTVRAQRSVSELRQRMISRQQDYRKEVETQLAEVGREVQADQEKYKAIKEEFGRVEIKSPVSGQVVGLAFQTNGGVVGPGQKLMDIVPGKEALLIEARVPPHLIDRVRAGLPVDVRFSNFSHTPQLVVDAQVTSVSSDIIMEPPPGISYYLARVNLTDKGLKELGSRELQPGMPAEVVFKTGERSLLKYILSPLTKRLAASMKEE